MWNDLGGSSAQSHFINQDQTASVDFSKNTGAHTVSFGYQFIEFVNNTIAANLETVRTQGTKTIYALHDFRFVTSTVQNSSEKRRLWESGPLRKRDFGRVCRQS
jgi:hypothetical protein